MKYYNRITGILVANSDEELQEYYERTYKENIEGGYINANECSLEDWISGDGEIEGVDE